jgi:hypothetical protein
LRGTAAKNLRLGKQLSVNFQTDDGLVFFLQLGRNGGLCGEFGHDDEKL